MNSNRDTRTVSSNRYFNTAVPCRRELTSLGYAIACWNTDVMLDVWNRCCVHFVGLTASFVAFSTLIWVGISLLLSRWMRWPLSTLEQKSIPVTKISRFPSSIYFQIWVGSFFLYCFVKQARRASKLQPQTTTKQSSIKHQARTILVILIQ